MKKIIALLLTAVLALSICGCSNTENRSVEIETTVVQQDDIDGYEYANFDTYNSYAEDNGLKGTKVYIKGVVKSVFDFAQSCNMSVVSEDEGRWLVSFLGSDYNEVAEDLFDDKEIVCFGEYGGFSDVVLMPVIHIDKIEISGKTYTASDIEEQVTEEPTTMEPTTVKIAEPQTETTNVYTELYSNNDLVLYYVSAEKYKYEDDKAIVNFFVENKTDKVLELSSGLIVLDGISYNKSIMSDEVAANSKGYIDASIENTQNFNPSSIGLTFTYKEPYSSVDTWEKVIVSETKIK